MCQDHPGAARNKTTSFSFDDSEQKHFQNKGLVEPPKSTDTARGPLSSWRSLSSGGHFSFGSAKVKALMSEVVSGWVHRRPPPFLALAPPQLQMSLAFLVFPPGGSSVW